MSPTISASASPILPQQSAAKRLALAGNISGADKIPDKSQLMMGFTSTQTAALAPDNLPSFETLRGVTNQWPGGYFAAGCAMHLSHLYLDLAQHGLGSRSCGPDVLPKYALWPRPVSASITFRVRSDD